MPKETESCGRCSMSVVVGTVEDDEDGSRDPFGDDRIEVDERELARVSPGAWASRVTGRIDDAVNRFVWGR